MCEQGGEIGIGRLVVDYESGIDRNGPATRRRIDGVAMASDPAILLVHGHIVSLVQQPRRRHPGNARADDGKPQSAGFPVSRLVFHVWPPGRNGPSRLALYAYARRSRLDHRRW